MYALAAGAVTAAAFVAAQPAAALDLGSTTQTVTSTAGTLTGTTTGTLTDTTGTVTGTTGSTTGTVTGTTGSTTGTVTGTTGSTTGTVGSTTGTVTGTVGSTTGTVTDTVGSTTGTVTGTVGSTTGTVTNTVGSATGTVTNTVNGTTGTVSGTTGTGTGTIQGAVGTLTGTTSTVGGTVSGTTGVTLPSTSGVLPGSGGSSGTGTSGSTSSSGGGNAIQAAIAGATGSSGSAGRPGGANSGQSPSARAAGNMLLASANPFAAGAGAHGVGAAALAAQAAAQHGLAPGVTPLATLLADRIGSPTHGGAGGGPSFGDAIGSILKGLPDWSRPIIAVLLAVALVLWFRSAITRRRLRRMRREQERLVLDLGVLQGALVPPLPAQLGGLALSVAYSPAEGLAAGGDFYDVFPLAGGRTGIVLGDASGHGRDAIARAAAVRYSLRAYLEAGLEPRAALQMGQAADDDDSLDLDFATVAVAVHDSADGRLTYACAGHPPPILTGPAAHEPVIVCASPPLGWGVNIGQRQTVVALPPGSSATFFTDGLIEAKRNGELFGRERLERLVGGLGDEHGAHELLRRLEREVTAGGDDMAALIVRSTEGPATTLLRIEELELTPAELEGGTAATFLAACGLDQDEIDRATGELRASAAGRAHMMLRVAFEPDAISVDTSQPAPPPVVGGTLLAPDTAAFALPGRS